MEPLVLGLRVLVSLAAVFGLMWVLHRRLRAGSPGLRARVLDVVARQSVGPKASVVLVDTDGRRFLLGVTEHGISVLHTADVPQPALPDPDHDALPGDAASPPLPTRRSVRQASFETELARRRAELGEGAAHERTGSVLDPATWRLAAEALRSGRRP